MVEFLHQCLRIATRLSRCHDSAAASLLYRRGLALSSTDLDSFATKGSKRDSRPGSWKSCSRSFFRTRKGWKTVPCKSPLSKEDGEDASSVKSEKRLVLMKHRDISLGNFRASSSPSWRHHHLFGKEDNGNTHLRQTYHRRKPELHKEQRSNPSFPRKNGSERALTDGVFCHAEVALRRF